MSEFATRRVMMVDTQVRPSDVTKFPIIEAMLSVPREAYVPGDKREAAYVGENLDIGGGRVVLEARTLAKMLDALDIQPTEMVLDIGCGLGYSAAVIARLADAVVAVEEDPALAAEAQRLLSVEGVDNAAVMTGPLVNGAPKHAPYDVITVQGGVDRVPDALLAQLKDGGRIAALFMDDGVGTVKVGYKIDGKMTWRPLFNASAPVLDGFAVQRGFAL
ncbi:MAG: protein-L-isoaspartate O-methyltransferase [Tabrizicola sp.]|uniref:protein-L-isoaspartate O-methyltransferase family protein n=1 Tax=Tabrizicola sp. TaxID=2005166 RepID=UPI0027364F39|nr:protein-L-isoaspartate O-methyltransferase [Tabrizicola sp.]MDP3265112.1 protein-L-isoaspartate O-methyltransferase [Tabrizicola sp.]MDP3646880.1 protein-L-isoaspartate O-methyltransferase [Paracoccaceae bacterium]MDZ4068267.1 protein-L-isoaspartate O-methyltransferase [Tabrizicola sp.]